MMALPRLDPGVVLDRLGLQQITQDTEVEWKARCPVHEDRTPSFYVNVAKGKFYCFGCMYKGSLVELIEDRLTQTADMPHIEAAILAARMRPGPAVLADALRTKTTPILPESFLDQFHRLKSSDYLTARGISMRTAHIFGVRYDSQNHRLVIPMRDEQDRLVGWIQRELHQNREPKYLYSHNFPKSTALFNVAAARLWRRALVMEGTFDVLRAYTAGYQFGVATLGNALSPEQANILQRCVEVVWLAFDNDPPDRDGVRRGELFTEISLLRLAEVGLKARTVVMPRGRKDIGECTTRELHHILKGVKPHGTRAQAQASS